MATYVFAPPEPLTNAEITTVLSAAIGQVPQNVYEIVSAMWPEFTDYFVALPEPPPPEDEQEQDP